jgi:hypothetical protein
MRKNRSGDRGREPWRRRQVLLVQTPTVFTCLAAKAQTHLMIVSHGSNG